jgi:formylglycine-generating enzyme required for sulfatase activity
VGAFPDDVSSYGVLDLAGNVSEWTLNVSIDGNSAFRVVRGGNWDETDSATLVDFMPIPNSRPLNGSSFAIGFRCVTNLAARPETAPR